MDIKKKNDIILIGGGGHCRSCIDVIESTKLFNIIGIIDNETKSREKVLNYKIIGSDTDIKQIIKKHKCFIVTIGPIKNQEVKVKLFNYIKELNGILPVILSPTAYISKYATIKEGTIVMHNAFINTNVSIGVNCIINTSAIVEHDSIVEDHCNISTGSIINGGCFIGKNTFIGSNAVISNNVRIPENTVIGAGSVVVKTVEKNGIYVGNPARKV